MSGSSGACILKEFAQLFGRKARIAEYRAEQTDRNVATRVHRYDDMASIWVNEYGMRASLAIEAKARPY